MTETTPLTRDLARLAGRAYHAGEWNVALLRRYHAWVAGAPGRAEEPRLARLYPWLFVPPTLWPFHIADALAGCLAALEADKRVSPRLRLAVELLPEPPSDPICRAVAEHEHHVQAGRYEHLLTSPAKYQQLAATVRDNPALLADWARLKAAFPVARYRDHKGVIRRSMATERNLRAGFGLPAHSGPRVLFTAAFDAFCMRHGLYGMAGDEPLPLKLAVNVTPFGTLVFLPARWSIDPKRDLRWAAIARLHRLRVPGRQGAALAEGEAERRRLARRLRTLDAQAKRRNLRGEAKHRFLCAGLGWDERTSPRRLARLRKEFTD